MRGMSLRLGEKFRVDKQLRAAYVKGLLGRRSRASRVTVTVTASHGAGIPGIGIYTILIRS